MQALGSAPEDIRPGVFERFSTDGKRGDQSGWCHLFVDGRAGIFGDFKGNLSLIWRLHNQAAMTAAERHALRVEMKHAHAVKWAAQADNWEKAGAGNARLWTQCRAIAPHGQSIDPAALYLRRRLALTPCEPLALSPALRSHNDLPYYSNRKTLGRWPALVALMQAPDGNPVALHRTWITRDGHKARPDPHNDLPVKKLTGASGRLGGACIRLAAWEAPKGGPNDGLVGIAEGIETAIAAMLGSGVPTHAAYCAGSLAAWQWPPTARRLVIFADNDSAGLDGAERLAQRARAAGLAVQLLAPKEPGRDWCDVWAARPAGAPPHVIDNDLTHERGRMPSTAPDPTPPASIAAARGNP